MYGEARNVRECWKTILFDHIEGYFRLQTAFVQHSTNSDGALCPPFCQAVIYSLEPAGGASDKTLVVAMIAAGASILAALIAALFSLATGRSAGGKIQHMVGEKSYIDEHQ
jgi:hypothetical protein